MRDAASEEALLSREELDALLEEMPSVLPDRLDDAGLERELVADVGLQRANEAFAYAHGLKLSNLYQRVVQFSLIGQRPIEMQEMAELMLPTDLLGAFEVSPHACSGFLLLSRPFFFQMLSMSFGAGPTIKPSRPPTREYSRIERRFYERAAREMLDGFAQEWRSVAPVGVNWVGLRSRSAVAESDEGHAILATFDVKGFSEACRVRVAIPAKAFPRIENARPRPRPIGAATAGVSVLDVPLKLRAQVGTARLSLAEVGRLEPGQLLPLEAPSDGSLTIRIGDRDKFRGVAGSRGARRAVQLHERLNGAE